MRVLVLAQGTGRRWDTDDGPYLGRPKHFVQVDGETLLHRQVRLFASRGCEVVVVAPDDPAYDVPPARRVTLDDPDPTGSNMSKFTATAPLWAADERTVITWGDCWLEARTVDSIVDHPGDDYHVWRRPGASATTGARWDESFAVSFGPAEHDRVLAAADRIVDLVRSGRLRHRRVEGADPTHIRTHLAAMCGVSDHQLDDVEHTASLPNQTHVDGWDDDFDTPAEWRGWIGRRMAGRYRVGVCIPWSAGERWRNNSFEWTTRLWRHYGLPVFLGDDTTAGKNPNRSAMRNDAARKALDAGCDVLFFADADTFVLDDQVWAAAHLALDRNQAVLAFDVYTRATRGRTIRSLRTNVAGVDRRFVRSAGAGGESRRSHASGAYAIPARLWHQVGGYDERFVRWGFEDRAFWLACNTFGGVAPRIAGQALHWWHPPAPDKDRRHPEHLEAAALARRYYTAAAWVPDSGAVLRAIEQGDLDPIELADDATPDVDAMRSILAEPGAPLATVPVV